MNVQEHDKRGQISSLHLLKIIYVRVFVCWNVPNRELPNTHTHTHPHNHRQTDGFAASADEYAYPYVHEILLMHSVLHIVDNTQQSSACSCSNSTFSASGSAKLSHFWEAKNSLDHEYAQHSKNLGLLSG